MRGDMEHLRERNGKLKFFEKISTIAIDFSITNRLLAFHCYLRPQYCPFETSHFHQSDGFIVFAWTLNSEKRQSFCKRLYLHEKQTYREKRPIYIFVNPSIFCGGTMRQGYFSSHHGS